MGCLAKKSKLCAGAIRYTVISLPRCCGVFTTIFTDHNPYAMFVRTECGGHLGFFEGGIIRANHVTWIERLVLQYLKACSEIVPKFKTSVS